MPISAKSRWLSKSHSGDHRAAQDARPSCHPKDKELAVAQAELNIQRANAQASKYAAEAIAAKGKAEADVLAAMYRAKAQTRTSSWQRLSATLQRLSTQT